MENIETWVQISLEAGKNLRHKYVKNIAYQIKDEQKKGRRLTSSRRSKKVEGSWETPKAALISFSGKHSPAWHLRWSAGPSYLETWSLRPHPPDSLQ